MTRYLLDTNHAGAILRENPHVLGHVASLGDAELSICVPSIGELWFMLFNSARAAENRQKLEGLLRRLNIVHFGLSEAEEFGRIRVELRRRGQPVPQIDIQIAAVAGFALATSDHHFNAIGGLRLENWVKR